MYHPRPEDKDWETNGEVRSQDYSAAGIRYLAQKYNCELVEVREEWKQYLREHKLSPGVLVSGDGVHPNVVGDNLLAALVGRHFRFNPLIPDPWAERVRTYALVHPLDEGADDEIRFTGTPWMLTGNLDDGRMGLGTSPDSALTLTFTGNRVDILSIPLREHDVKLGTAKIRIDGKPPSADPRLYAYTRPDPTPGSWFPAVLHLEHTAPLVAEDWTMRITAIDEKATHFSYEISGSVTGPDGAGNNQERFVSRSGRIIIKPQDLERITWSHQNMAKCPVGQEFKWKVIPQFVDTYTPPVATDASRTYAVTVAQGLANTTHTLEIIPNGDGAVPISAIQVYCPPMK